MRKLHVLSNRAGLPCNELIHIAVGLLYAETRDLILHLLTSQEQTGVPLHEVADAALATPADAPEALNEPYAVATETCLIPQHPQRPMASPHHHRCGDEVRVEPIDNTPTIAAESPPSGPRVQQYFTF